MPDKKCPVKPRWPNHVAKHATSSLDLLLGFMRNSDKQCALGEMPACAVNGGTDGGQFRTVVLSAAKQGMVSPWSSSAGSGVRPPDDFASNWSGEAASSASI
jgi:hypothetical protein